MNRRLIKNKAKDGFSLVELIIVIAIMAILVGVIALAVIPNIRRSRESKDISALDNIASAANAAIASTQASGAGVINLGKTDSGVKDVTGYDPDSANEQQKLQHVIFTSLPQGAGTAESDTIGKDSYIAFAYDVSKRIIQVAYVKKVNASADTYSKLTGIPCNYIEQDFFVSNGS